MKKCKTCGTWLCADDSFQELPEDSGLYVCDECYDNPPNWIEEEFVSFEWLYDVEPRIGRD